MISVFSDRIEILSRGALPPAQTMEAFYLGESIPVNEKLSEIFLQLYISENCVKTDILKESGRRRQGIGGFCNMALKELYLSKGWEVVFNKLTDELDPDLYPNDPDFWLHSMVFVEDIVYIRKVEDKTDIAVDLGWYPDCDPNGSFGIDVIKNNNWNEPVDSFQTRSLEEAVNKINDVLFCYSETNTGTKKIQVVAGFSVIKNDFTANDGILLCLKRKKHKNKKDKKDKKGIIYINIERQRENFWVTAMQDDKTIEKYLFSDVEAAISKTFEIQEQLHLYL